MATSEAHTTGRFRLWAALMLWVWLTSQALCVAHCHGAFPGAFEVSSRSGFSGAHSSGSHRCCSNNRSHRSSLQNSQGGAGVLATSPASSSAQAPAAADPSPGDEDSANRSALCGAHAVVRWADSLTSLGAPTGIPVTDGPPFDAHGYLLSDAPGSASETAFRNLIPPRFTAPSVPRWDSGFEPRVTLGSGLRALAPPRV